MTVDINLALYLDAPMQSWGYQSRFDRRTTLSHPTRSGVTGMICAAMGVERSDSQTLVQLAKLKITTLTFQQKGRLTDFHTVGGGWNKKTNSQNIVQTALGKTGDTVVSQREYLQWSKFGVIINGQDKELNRIADALLDPCWGIWLGRKSCIPASPVYQGLFPTIEEAVDHLIKLAKSPVQRIVKEVSSFEDGSDIINDIPLNFAKRRFAPRRISM